MVLKCLFSDLLFFKSKIEIVPAVNQVETHPFCQQLESHELTKYNKSVAQVILRWLTQRDIVVIPKSAHKERIMENFNIFDFDLNQEDMKKIASLDTKDSVFFSHRDPSFVRWIGKVKYEI